MDKPKRQPKASFSQFIERFPEIPLPVTLAEEAHHAFSQKNDPLPALMIEQFVLPIEGQPMDDYTEFVPCMRIPETHDFHGIIYWRAMLMSYQYTLVTFTKKGELIDQRVIAGTISQGETLTTSVATIEDDWTIYIVSGQNQISQTKGFDPAKSTANRLELLPEGKITEHL